MGARGDGKLRIDLRVLKAPTGDTVASLPEAGTEDNLFDLVSLLGREVRRELGWTDPSPEQVRAAQKLQPESPEAERSYAQGLDKLRVYDAQGARDLLQQAVAAEPHSAVVHSDPARSRTGVRHHTPRPEVARDAGRPAASPARQPTHA